MTVFEPVGDAYGVELDVNTTGHMALLESERAFWDVERDAIAEVVRSGTSHLPDVDDQIIKAGRHAVKVIAGYSLVAAFGVSIAIILLHFKGIELSAGFTGVGAALGAAFGIRRARAQQP